MQVIYYFSAILSIRIVSVRSSGVFVVLFVSNWSCLHLLWAIELRRMEKWKYKYENTIKNCLNGVNAQISKFFFSLLSYFFMKKKVYRPSEKRNNSIVLFFQFLFDIKWGIYMTENSILFQLFNQFIRSFSEAEAKKKRKKTILHFN